MDQRDLPFLPTNAAHPAPNEAPALCDDNSHGWISYGALRRAIKKTAEIFSGPRGLVLCAIPRSIEGVIAYLAAVHAGHAVLLVDPGAPNLDNLIDSYQPEWVIGETTHEAYDQRTWALSTLPFHAARNRIAIAPHLDFFLLLLTSGSTGSGKAVRLSYNNMAHNTATIIQSLNLTNAENALCHLPLSYSFGLSVLHTQLAVGGRCLLSEQSMMSIGLWNLARKENATLFAGVPMHYEILLRLGLSRLNLPRMHVFLQAGGKMQTPQAQKMLDTVRERENGRFFVMYGQTEAAPRMACLPLHETPEKIGTCGRALDGGTFLTENDEVIYRGPNVMMGYAERRKDLSQGDTSFGRLATGDLGNVDADGYLTITGRAKRFAKLFGQRIALDDLEKIAAPLTHCAAVETLEKIVLAITTDDTNAAVALKTALVEHTNLPAPWFDVRTVDAIPTKPNGKIDYNKLRDMVG